MKLLSLLIITFFTFQFNAQKKVETVKIKTSAECGMCKDRLEEKLNYTKGIVFAELHVESKILTVRYKTKKISLDQIKNIVSQIGYDADEVKAIPEAVQKLPKCCQPGGMGN
jgi:mercuric ion binding protein